MATLAAVLATTHHPFYLKATTAPPEQQMPQAPEWKRKVEAYRETLTRAKPDILVMVGADHFHQFFLDNYPTFLIGQGAALRRHVLQRRTRIRAAEIRAAGARRAVEFHASGAARSRLRLLLQP